MNRLGLLMLALAVGACSNSRQIDVRVAQMCKNRSFTQHIQTVRVVVEDPTGRNAELDEQRYADSGDYTTGQISLEGVPTYMTSEGALDSPFVVRWYGSESPQPPFEASSILGYGASGHLSFSDDDNSDRQVFLPLMQVGRFSPTTDLKRSFDLVNAGEVCSQMVADRYGHTATYIPALGKVLLVGGRTTCDSGETCRRQPGEGIGVTDLVTAELFDPGTGLFEELPVPPPPARAFHSATLLGDDIVLIAGGRRLRNTEGAEEVLGTAYLFSATLYKSFKEDEAPSPWTNAIAMGTNARYARVHHSAMAINDRKALLAGGIFKLNGPGLPSLDPDLVGVEGNTAPTIVVFELGADRHSGEFTPASSFLNRPRAGGKLVKRPNQSGGKALIIGGYDTTGPIAAVEEISNLNGPPSDIIVSEYATLPVPVFGHTATDVNGRVLVYGGFTSFPDLSSAGLSCDGLSSPNFCNLEWLRLRIPGSGVAKENLIQSMTHTVQVVDLGTESAFEVGNARETDPASSDFLPNDLAGRVWHQAVALEDGRVVIGGGLGRKHLRDTEYEVTHEAGVAFEVCEVEPTVFCQVPKSFRFSGDRNSSGRSDFRLTHLPGDVLLATGGRGGLTGIQQGQDTPSLNPSRVAQLGVAPLRD
ncbi:MAG: hypothetical protein CMH55_11295 [Myxococcales bacterium]|nr:hypothetical protein [Myxococcales bacterium]